MGRGLDLRLRRARISAAVAAATFLLAATDHSPAAGAAPGAVSGAVPRAESAVKGGDVGSAKRAERRRMRRALRAINGLTELEPTAQRRWPRTFAGLWLDDGKVVIAFTEKAKKRVKQLRKDPGDKLPRKRRGRMRAVTFDDTLLELRALQAQMVADREVNPISRTIPGSGRESPRTIPVAYDLDIDVRSNAIVAIVDDPITPELLTAFAQRYGPDVVVKRGPLAQPESLFVCKDRTSCVPRLRSGLLTVGSTSCSTGFTVSYTWGLKGILSAAHCGQPDKNPFEGQHHAGGLYGNVNSEQQAGRVDAELHSVVGAVDQFTPWIAGEPWIYANDSDRQGRVIRVGTHAGLPVGYEVCKSGQVTAQSCGEVLSKWFSADPDYLPGMTDFVRTSACSNPGDSGSGVYHKFPQLKSPPGKKHAGNYEAIGILSGGPTKKVIENGVEKKVPLLCGDPEDESIVGHIEFAEQALGVKVLEYDP